MTLAIVLWLVRSTSAALWLVEHVVLALRAHRAGASLVLACLVPAVPRWRAGDRAGPAAWCVLAALYAVATALSFRLR